MGNLRGLFITLALGASAWAQGNGSLKVDADPGRAGVFIDGKYVGPASNLGRTRTYSIPSGEHELILREPRYQESKTTIRIESGEVTRVTRKLERRKLTIPPFGTLRVIGFEKYAAVFVNEQFMGHADEFNARRQGLLLNPGEYTVRVVALNGSPLLERKVTIQEKSTEILRK
jgi:hypothetical protein